MRALTAPGHEGKAYTITGAESTGAAGYAKILSGVIVKPVQFVDVPPEAARDGMLKSGMPEDYVTPLMDLLAVMKAGHADAMTNGVRAVLGRAPPTFESWARRNRAAFV